MITKHSKPTGKERIKKGGSVSGNLQSKKLQKLVCWTTTFAGMMFVVCQYVWTRGLEKEVRSAHAFCEFWKPYIEINYKYIMEICIRRPSTSNKSMDISKSQWKSASQDFQNPKRISMETSKPQWKSASNDLQNPKRINRHLQVSMEICIHWPSKSKNQSKDISKSQWKFASKGLQNHAVVTLTSIFFFFKLKFRDRSVFFFLFSFCFPSKLTYLYKTSKLMFSKGVLVQAGWCMKAQLTDQKNTSLTP